MKEQLAEINQTLTKINHAIPKIIPRPVHAALDYGYAGLFFAAPELANFENEKTASRLARTVSAGVFVSSLMTRYEFGLIKMMPFKAHLAVDVAVGVLTAAAPFAFGFSRNKRARNFFTGFGLFSVVAGLLTEPEEMGAEKNENLS
jgi:hypothetical protein